LNEISEGYGGIPVADNCPYVDGGEYVVVVVSAAHEQSVINPVKE
jgi:hypothetical protein